MLKVQNRRVKVKAIKFLVKVQISSESQRGPWFPFFFILILQYYSRFKIDMKKLYTGNKVAFKTLRLHVHFVIYEAK